MKKMNKRKGFTLTELAIVIAVIAILIAVLVPTFVSLINKAKESNDSQLAKNMNTLLTDEEISGNTPTRMEDVNEILVNGGYTIAKLTPSADGNIFVWNEETNRISYISTENWSVIYAGDSTLSTGDILDRTNNYWVTVESADEINSWSNLSYYFGANISKNITFASGADSSIDTGTYKLTGTLSYGSSEASVSNEQQTAKTSVNSVKAEKAATASTIGTAKIMGTITNLVVNSDIKVVNYSSIKEKATLTNVTSYTESGSTKELAVNTTTTTSTVTITNSGVVSTLSGSSTTTKIENNGYVYNVDTSSSLSTSNITNNGQIVNVSGTTNTTITNSSNYSYKISSYSELANFRDKVNNGTTFAGIEVDLTANIDMSGRSWVPIGYDSRDNRTNTNFIYFGGTFNGNGNTISGLTNTGYTPTELRTDTYGYGSGAQSAYLYGLFGILKGANVNNVKLTNVNIAIEETELDSVGGIAGFALDGTTISSCTVSGSIAGTDAVAGIVGRIYMYNAAASTVSVTNCTNNATITATATEDGGDTKAAGIIGTYLNEKGDSSYKSQYTLTVTGCINNGNVTATTMAAGILVTKTGQGNIAIGGCTNNGKITVTDKDFSDSKRGYASIGSIYCFATGTNTSNNGNDDGYLNTSSACYNYGTLGTALRVWNFTTNGDNSTYKIYY